MAPYLSIARLLAALPADGSDMPVADLWRALRCERRELAAWLAEHRDDLAAAGVALRYATTSQAAGPKTLYIELGDKRYRALSRPAAPQKPRKAPAQVEAAAPLAVVEPAPLAPLGTLTQAGQAANHAAARDVLTRYRATLAAETRRAQDADLERWAAYLGAVGVEGAGCDWSADPGCWRGVSWGLVEGFIVWQEGQGLARATIARALSTVRGYAERAAQAGEIAADEAQRIAAVHAPGRGKAARNRDAGREQTRAGAKKAAPVSITRAQARALKREHPDTPAGRRDALLMCLLLDHGLRVSEAHDLAVSDLDLAAGVMRFYRRKVDRTQVHTLTRDTLRAARRYEAAGDIPAAGQLLRATEHTGSADLGGPASIQSLRRRVALLGARVGLPGLSPHDCRHAWATWASESGTPIRDLQEAGGWSSPAMPLRYAEAARVANERVNLGDDEEGTEDE